MCVERKEGKQKRKQSCWLTDKGLMEGDITISIETIAASYTADTFICLQIPFSQKSPKTIKATGYGKKNV